MVTAVTGCKEQPFCRPAPRQACVVPDASYCAVSLAPACGTLQQPRKDFAIRSARFMLMLTADHHELARGEAT